jgi:Tol biopolymer transport system component
MPGGTEGSDEHTEIYAVDAKTGGDLHALTSCVGLADGCFNDLPVWSPDGTRIAYMHGVYDPIADAVVDEQVWVMDVDGGNPHPLTSDSAGFQSSRRAPGLGSCGRSTQFR